jgi:hypothetical protein
VVKALAGSDPPAIGILRPQFASAHVGHAEAIRTALVNTESFKL